MAYTTQTMTSDAQTDATAETINQEEGITIRFESIPAPLFPPSFLKSGRTATRGGKLFWSDLLWCKGGSRFAISDPARHLHGPKPTEAATHALPVMPEPNSKY